MKTRIVLELDENNGVWDADGNMIGILQGSAFTSEDKSEVFDRITELLEQGVNAKEIIKLKKAGLL